MARFGTVFTMKPSGIAIVIGERKGAKAPADDSGGDSMNVGDEARRSALTDFFRAAKAGDVDAGMKAWASMAECGPPKQAEGSDEEEASESSDEEAAEPVSNDKPARRGMYRD